MNLFELGEGHVNKYWKKSAVKKYYWALIVNYLVSMDILRV